MTTTRSAALAIAMACLAAGPASAATCNLTVLGTHVIDDASCMVVRGRGVTRVLVDDGSAVVVRRSTMSARVAGDPLATRRGRRAYAGYGRVVVTDDTDGRRCYFNQKATLCVDD